MGSTELVMIYSWWKYTDIPGEEFPNWADALGWMMTLTVIVAIFGGAIVTIGSAEGDFRQRMQYATNPTVEWGPFLVKHRAEVEKYIPGFVVDPWGGDVRHNPPATPGERDFVLVERNVPPNYNNVNVGFDASRL